MSQAGLIDIEASHPQIATKFDGDSGSAIPVSNLLEIQGLAVANATYAKSVFVTASGNTVVTNVQVGKARTGSPANSNDAGLSSFDDTLFQQDANGYVTILGTAFGKTITGDTGGALSPTASNWNIFGDAAQGISSSGAASTLTFTIADATTTTKGVSSYNTTDFSLTIGAVSLIDSVVKSVTTDSGVMTPAGHSFSILGGEGINVTHSGTTITVAGEDWSTTNKGIGELATDAEAQLLASSTVVLTPSNMGAVFAPEKQSGFQEWTGAGSYYTINTTDFVLDRPGIGWINSKQVTWAGGQTESTLSAGATHYIYVDSSGTIGSTTTRSTALFQDNIVLFEVLVDSDTPANVIVVKENHSMKINPQVMEFCHDIGLHGFNVTEEQAGGVISIHGTLGIQVAGNTEWLDHDLETDVPDSAAAAITLNVMYTDAGGKWVLEASQNTVPTEYNNAGTPTALAGNERAIHSVWASKDDLESAAPQYFDVMGDVLYTSLAQARTALALDQFTVPTNELLALEMVRMGYLIVNATTIDEVTSDKQTIGTGTVNSTGGSANLISVDVTNFNGVLDATDTTVQTALETIDDAFIAADFTVSHGSVSLDDDVLKALAGDTGLAAGSGHSITIAGGVGCSTVAGGSTVTVNVPGGGFDWTRVAGVAQALAVSNGYTPTNVALTTFTLPATAALGDIIKIDGEGTGLWAIAQNAGQQIHVGVISSTSGAGGSVESTHRRDCITLRCVVVDTEFIAENFVGNIGAT